MKGITPKIRMLCFVLINSVLLCLLCVRIRASFAQYGPCGLWKNATGSESGELGAGRLRSARTRSDDSCTPACVWPKLDQAIQTGFGQVLQTI